MATRPFVDYYAALELGAGASGEVVEQVYAVLAKRYHPDNPETGDAERYKLVVAAHKTLTDPEARPRYDAYYERSHPSRAGAGDSIGMDTASLEADKQLRLKMLGVLYDARRKEGPKGIGDYRFEQAVGISMDELQFHMWYLTAKGWVERTGAGQIVITAQGVDELTSSI